MASNLLPSLSALSLDTGAKEKTQKAAKAAKAASDPPYQVIALKEFAEEDLPIPTIKTSTGGPNATQAERKWLRQQYGNNWASVGPMQKEKMKQQARKVLAHEFAPLIEDQLASAKLSLLGPGTTFQTANYNDAGLPKLDFVKELVPFLNTKYPPDWRKSEDGSWLDQTAKDTRAATGKAEWRATRSQELEAKKEAEWLASPVRQQVLTEKIEELHNPDTKGIRRARALLRHWFNRPGSDGTKRHWKTSVDTIRSKARLKWAQSIVLTVGYDHTNPPQPPEDLYAMGDVKPSDQLSLPDPVKSVSDQGGQWVWKYMRALSSTDIENTQTYTDLSTVESASRYWESSFRNEQMTLLKDVYTEFISSLDDMPDLPGAKDAAYSYTVGSGKFNKYILWPSNKIGGDPSKIPTYGAGAGGVGGDQNSGVIGPPDLLHRLYKLINRCPRLPRPCQFIRGVKTNMELPHNLGKQTSTTPVKGKGYLNVTFMSTSTAAPDSYLSGILSGFYNKNDNCCLYVITAPAGTPVLPLVLGGKSTSNYANEQEVMLPPGLVLVFQGVSEKIVGSSSSATIHFYEARFPPKIPLPVA